MLTNKQKKSIYDKVYLRNNYKRIITRIYAWRDNKRQYDGFYRLRCSLTHRLRKVLKGMPRLVSAVKDKGCSNAKLKSYLESKFTSEMTWDNYGTYWELDHIIPFNSFDLTDKEQQLKVIHFTNLQPISKDMHKIKTKNEKLLDKTE